MFFIEQMSGENYVYQFEDGETTVAFPFNENSNDWENWEDWDKNHRSNNVNDLGDIYNYMQQMEWYVQADLLFSESFRFEESEIVSSLSGELMLSSFELPAHGYYKLRITNVHTEDMAITVGYSTVNILLAGAAVVTWLFFGIAVAIFTFMIHIGVWVLVIYAIVKLVSLVNEDDYSKRPIQQVIGPEIREEERQL